MTQSNIPRHNPHTDGEPHVAPRARLGGDPGTLIASLPSMLGFTPQESLVIVGLFNVSEDDRHMRIGPVARADLNPGSISCSMDQILAALEGLKDPEVVLVAISRDTQFTGKLVEVLAQGFEELGVGINGLHLVRDIAEGERWYFPDETDGGALASLDDNPVANIAKCTGALQLGDWDAREQWLYPTTPRISHKEWALTEDSEGNPYDNVDLIDQFSEYLRKIEEGEVSLADACRDEDIVMAFARVAADVELHAVAVLFAQGTSNPIIRDVVAESVRRSRGAGRHRLMIVLALILASNDEAALAHYVVCKALDEMSVRPRLTDADDLTLDMIHHTKRVMDVGQHLGLLRLVLEHALRHLSWLHFECMGTASDSDVETGFCESGLSGDHDDLFLEELAHELYETWISGGLEDELDRALNRLEWPAIFRALER